MSETNALDYRYVKRAIYDRYTDRMESKLQRLKADIRSIEQQLAVTLQRVENISTRAAVFVASQDGKDGQD